MESAYEQMILAFCKWLDASGGTVISANTVEGAMPPVFAQTPEGELAFYFVLSPDQTDLTSEQKTKFLETAKRHEVLPLVARTGVAGSEPQIEKIEIPQKRGLLSISKNGIVSI